MKKYLSIFWSFIKIGTFTFGGGYAMIPIIEREIIDKKKWIAKDEFLDLLTLAQAAPGPISLNTSVFVGYRVAGYWGAIAAILGVIIPSFVIILAIAVYLDDFRSNRYVNAAFKGMRPAVVALITTPIIGLVRGMGVWKILAAIAAAFIVSLLGVSPIYFIIAGAVVGLLYAHFNKKGLPPNLSEEAAEELPMQIELQDSADIEAEREALGTIRPTRVGNRKNETARVKSATGEAEKSGGRQTAGRRSHRKPDKKRGGGV